MSPRRTVRRQPKQAIVGWVEVWSTTPGQGFAVEGVVPLTRLVRSGRRKPRVLPKKVAA